MYVCMYARMLFILLTRKTVTIPVILACKSILSYIFNVSVPEQDLRNYKKIYIQIIY